MEEKRRDGGSQPAASSAGAETSATTEPTSGSSSRRRAGGNKRKANAIGSTNSQSTPAKRHVREKALISSTHTPPSHNGPLTRARQGPNNSSSGQGVATRAKREDEAAAAATMRKSERAEEEMRKASEDWEALEAKIEAEFEAIRSRDSNAHVVPNHCGWFSWTKIHPIEERALSSFFNGKTQTRSPDIYMEIRNWIVKKFHANPNQQIELKDLSELEVGDQDGRKEVMEFLDYWGLINFHPFPPTSCTPESTDVNEAEKTASSLEKLYRFESVQSRSPVVSKPKLAAPTVPSKLFSETTLAEELDKQEGPAYHCNYCSADCSHKRYHCQTKADYDLCTDCFSNQKFGSDMSSSDFILMELAEGSGPSGGNWTDQETLLLLEALELYKENWNEIAEHVATKTKAQCILHFVQMPIEDTFLDCDDEVEPSSKETADPVSGNDDISAPETTESKTDEKTEDTEGQPQTSAMEITNPEDDSGVKVADESSKAEDATEGKLVQESSKSDDKSEEKASQETDENVALKALKEAFETMGYSSTPENPLSFAEVGNPVMALALFLTRLVETDVVTASAHNSLKALSSSEQGMQLASRHCFILEDPPDAKKETTKSESAVPEVADQDKVQEDKNGKEENPTSVLAENDTLDVPSDKKVEVSVSEVDKPRSGDSVSKVCPEKELDSVVAQEENDSNSKDKLVDQDSLKDKQSGKESDDLGSKVSTSSGKESGNGTSEKNDSVQPAASKSSEEPSEAAEASKDVDMVSDSLLTEKNDDEPHVTSSSKEETLQTIEASKDVNMAIGSLPSETNDAQDPVASHSETDNGPNTGHNQGKDGEKDGHDSRNVISDQDIDRIKRAAVSTLSAAAVKANLLAKQEEDQIRMLTISLIEKQLQKLELKLGFFSEMENVLMRVREQLERSKQRLYHERAQIIATRLGIPPSTSRGMPPSLPTNRIATNFASSIQRPPLGLTALRPTMLRPMGPVAPPASIPPVPTTTASNSIQPANQDTLSPVGTK